MKQSPAELSLDMNEASEAFFEETHEALRQIDNIILKLEKDSKNPGLFDLLFRKIHTMKGGLSTVVGSKELGELLHIYESVLVELKSQKMSVESDSLDFWLFLTDTIKSSFFELKESKKNKPETVETIRKTVQVLEKIKNDQGSLKNINPFWRERDLTKEDNADDEGAWIPNARLEEFMRLSNELLILKNFHEMLLRNDSIREDRAALQKFSNEFSQNLSKITDQLQSQIAQSMKISLQRASARLPRIVRQTSGTLGKDVDLNMVGFDLELDRNLAKTISEGLIHMIRNSIDHGIETIEKRKQLGKPPAGSITMKAWDSDGVIRVKVTDDGAGINLEKVKEKALSLNIMTAEKLQALPESEALKLIFHPGFSTKEVASAVSGRGVGMDVVHAAIQQYNGNIFVTSKIGVGTEIVLEFPIPRKVVVNRTILCHWNDFIFAAPLDDIERILPCEEAKLTYMKGLRFAQFDGLTVPLLTFDEIKKQKVDDSEQATAQVRTKSMIVMRGLDRKFALLVDRIDQQLEVVIRPFSPFMKKVKGFKGTSILGEDLIAYVLSADEISELLSQNEVRKAV